MEYGEALRQAQQRQLEQALAQSMQKREAAESAQREPDSGLRAKRVGA